MGSTRCSNRVRDEPEMGFDLIFIPIFGGERSREARAKINYFIYSQIKKLKKKLFEKQRISLTLLNSFAIL